MRGVGKIHLSHLLTTACGKWGRRFGTNYSSHVTSRKVRTCCNSLQPAAPPHRYRQPRSGVRRIAVPPITSCHVSYHVTPYRIVSDRVAPRRTTPHPTRSRRTASCDGTSSCLDSGLDPNKTTCRRATRYDAIWQGIVSRDHVNRGWISRKRVLGRPL